MKFAIAFMFALIGNSLAQGLNQYNNRQDFFNDYSNPILPYCIFGNEPVCSTENETFANKCVLMLLGQRLKTKGWCETKISTEITIVSDKNSTNGYGQGTD